MTIQERLVAALVASGAKEVSSNSRKYRTFTRSSGGYYFVGKSGALRFGDCASKSISLPDSVKRAIMARFI